jgi:hypothetical protein
MSEAESDELWRVSIGVEESWCQILMAQSAEHDMKALERYGDLPTVWGSGRSWSGGWVVGVFCWGRGVGGLGYRVWDFFGRER